MNYFTDRIDYIFFFYGLAFLLLGTICLILDREEREKPVLPWIWLGLFGLVHGLNEWLDLLAFTFTDTPVFSCARLLVMALSFVFLFEFARRSKNTGAPVSAWVYLPLALLSASGYYYGLNGLNATVRYALGLTGGLLACRAVYIASAGKPPQLRRPLLFTSLGLGLYALTTGAIVPESAFFPARWLNYANFSGLFGLPVQLLRGVLACATAVGAWVYFLNSVEGETGAAPNKRKAGVGWLAIAGLLLAVGSGWALTDYLGNKAHAELLREGENLGKMLFNRFSDSLVGTEQTAAAMAGSPWIPEALTKNDAADIGRANSILDRYCASYGLSVCYLINLKGVTMAASNRNTPQSFVGKDYGFRPYFKEAAAGKPSRYFALGVLTKERGFYASCPVKSGGRTAGVAVVKKNLDFLGAELRMFPYTFLVSPEGIIFLSSRKELLFRSLWPIAGPKRGELAASNQFGTLDFRPVLRSEITDGEELNFEGDKFHVSRVPFKQEGWSLIGFNSTRPARMARFAGALISFVFCILLLTFFLVLIQSETARETAERLLALKEEVRTLSGIVPICANCKKIRDDKGYWNKVETYVAQHTRAQFSHGLCPACVKKIYPDYADKDNDDGESPKG